MKKFWGKVGWACMTFVPLLASIVIQLLMGLALGFIIGLMAGIKFGGAETIDRVAMDNYITDMIASSNSYVVLGYQLIALIVFAIWYYFGCGRPKITNPVKVFHGKSIPVTLILGFGMCLAANGFMLLSQFIMPKAFETYVELMEAAGIGVNPITIVASVILAPIGEEILCRGLIYHYAKKAVVDMKNRTAAFWIANTLQALMFGIMHLNLIQGLYAFGLGLGIGWLRERYKSLYPAMLAHFVVNFSSTFIIEHLLGEMPETLTYIIPLFIGSLVICAVAVVFEYVGKKKNAEMTA